MSGNVPALGPPVASSPPHTLLPPSIPPQFPSPSFEPPLSPPHASPTLPSPPIPTPPPYPPPSTYGVCFSLVRPQGTGLSVGLFYLLLSLPVLLFLLFLLLRAKQSLRRLRQTGSLVMTSYYTLLWAVCLVNLFRCIIEVLKRPETSTSAEHAWNSAWLASRFSLVFLETSVVVFLFQGYLVSGVEALVRTVIMAGAFAGIDTLVKATLIFRFHVPLFFPDHESVGHWSVWGFWTLHHSLFVAVYATILALPFTRYRDRLPARPSFYRYVVILLLIDVVSVVGSLMLAVGSETGYCVHGASGWLHSAIFPPLLYFTFLADFFKDDDLLVEDAYYSEMKEAGYFEDIE